MQIDERALPDSHRAQISDTGEWYFECDWCGALALAKTPALKTAIEWVEALGWEHQRCGIDRCQTCRDVIAKIRAIPKE